MKKVTILIAAVLLLLCAGCGNGGPNVTSSGGGTVGNPLSGMGKLEVYRAGIKVKNELFFGKGKEPDTYALTYSVGTVTYSIDLNDVKHHHDEDCIYILPELEVDFSVDENSTELLYSYQKNQVTGSTEEGYRAYLGSLKELDESIQNELKKPEGAYAEVYKAARTSAKEQVEQLLSQLGSEPGDWEVILVTGR